MRHYFSLAFFKLAFGLIFDILQGSEYNSVDSCYLPAGIYLLKVKNRNTSARCEICSKLTIKTPKGVIIINFEHISHLVLVFLLLTWNM